MDDLFDKIGPIIQAGAYAACVVEGAWLWTVLKRNEKLEAKLDAVQESRIEDGKELARIVEQNTVATTELGKKFHTVVSLGG